MKESHISQRLKLTINDYETSNNPIESLKKSVFENPRGEQKLRRQKKRKINESYLRKKITFSSTKKIKKQPLEQEQQREKEKEKEKQDLMKNKKIRKQNILTAAKQFLNGKTSIIWIFVIKGQVTQQQRNRICLLYKGRSNFSIVPLIKNAEQIESFLKIPNSILKITSDIQSFEQTQKKSRLDKVLQYHILNNKKEQGISIAVNFKSQNIKIKGIYISLNKIIDKAEDEVQRQYQLQYRGGEIKVKMYQKYFIFPSFLKLSNEDKSNATLYRTNLYEGINLLKKDRQSRYQDFVDFIRNKYSKQEDQIQNLEKYKSLDHFCEEFNEQFCTSIISFYSKQSFYYKDLNMMLKTLKNPTQFGLCIFPFYQTYNSIKFLYNKFLLKNNRTLKKQTLYRGATMRIKDFQKLKKGAFIETFGFLSTSKNKEIAKNFCTQNGYLFQIQIPTIKILEKYDIFDHGFIDVSEYSQFKNEQEVLFNPLNVFKVTNITKDGQLDVIHLEYGVMMSLMIRQRESLSQQQKDVLINYEYCCNTLKKIQDHGDVLCTFGQFENAIEYYNNKVQEEEKEANKQSKYYYKLADVQQKCGKLQEANENLKKALQIEQEKDELSIEKCLKVFSIHSKHASLNFQQEDYVAAEAFISDAINQLGRFEQNDIQKAKQLRQRGAIKFKKGDIRQAQKDFKEGQQILMNIYLKVLKQKQQIEKKSCCQSLIQYFSIQKRISRQIKISQIQQKIEKIKQQKQQINSEIFKLNNSCKQIYKYVEDTVKYQKCIKKGKAYVEQIQKIYEKKSSTPEQKAEMLFIKATVEDHQKLHNQQVLLEQAIQIMKNIQPFHIKVGQYSQILASKQKNQLNKFSNPHGLMECRLNKNDPPIIYNKQQHDATYQKCKKNYERAIVVAIYNENSPPKILGIKNQYAEMEYFQSKYERSSSIIRQGQKFFGDFQHTQLAQSYLLLSKIDIARGENKLGFMNLESAEKIARAAIVKKQQPKYFVIFYSSDIMIEIRMLMSRIYMKQLNHDLSLGLIKKIQLSIVKKIANENHSLLADLCELKAENYILLGKMSEAKKQFQKAISIRTKQSGKYSPANGILFCKFSRYLSLFNDLEQAQKYLNEAVEILSCFDEQHPLTWQLQFSRGTYYQKKNNFDEAVSSLNRSIKKISKQFDKDYIIISKLKLIWVRLQEKTGRIKEEDILQILNDLKDQLRASYKRNLALPDMKNSAVNVIISNPQRQLQSESEQSDGSQQLSSEISNLEINDQYEQIKSIDDQKIYIRDELRASLERIKKINPLDRLIMIQTNNNGNRNQSSTYQIVFQK